MSAMGTGVPWTATTAQSGTKPWKLTRIGAKMSERLTRWEGRDEDGPRAVTVKHDGPFAPIMQEILRKLARYEDAEEAAENDRLHD